ncbi:MAG: type II CRISPR-associated endonuclease Cas1 [Cohaesibacter sp.]|nr:type II CRISPR-associated endonuclease Cas1 [Cohaesibacter sp.]MCV6600944.1 type II CRISPR-associated endonuclease Cas1 [Cohaesibacter sp.]
MAWKGVHLTRPARLSVKSRQLRVKQDDGEVTIPLEDIGWIIADNHQTTLTVALMAACAEAGIAIITSDTRHSPSALTLPFQPNHRTASVAHYQLAARNPLKKRLWQTIIRTKINNQATLLQRAKRQNSSLLKKMASRVRSGDPDNIEARAARDYWTALFDNFTRGNEDDLRNKALNYAYAILRGCIARALVAAGLLPAIGLHHASQTNSFNLADDMIEPFRPFADLAVNTLLHQCDPNSDLTRDHRQMLAGLPLNEVSLNTETLSILHASELSAHSLVRAFEHADAQQLILPSFPETQFEIQGLVR